MDFAELKARYDEAYNYKGRWLALYKDLYLYVIPDRDAFNIAFNYRDDGKPTTYMVWDNTAVLAAYQRANDLHGLILPKDRIWGKFTLDPHRFGSDEIQSLQPTIDEINDKIFTYINDSNLSRVVSSSNLDLVGGTAALWVESISDKTPLYFRSIPAVALYIEYSTDDVVGTCWYKCKMSGRKILKTFPDYKGMCVRSLESQLDELFAVIYGQVRNDEDDYYIYAVLEDDPFYPLWERDSHHQQILVYRDRVRPGEAEGRGIGIDMLPTIRDLNHIVEDDRKCLAFKARPPIFYDADSYFNPYSVRQWAGAMIARNPQGRNPLEAMIMPDNRNVLLDIQDLREVIRRGFQVDPLGEIDDPKKSATEVSYRENRAQRTSATDISRLINELAKPVYEVSAKILSERRLLDKERSVQINLNSKAFKFDFVSPLYDIQNQEELNHFVTKMQIEQQFFGEGAAFASINIDEANNFLTKKLNLPAKLFKTGDQIKQFLAQYAQTAQQTALPASSTSAMPQQQIQAPQVLF